MKNKAWLIIAWISLGLGSFLLWLFFRPLMLALGIWTEADAGGAYLLQLINAAYLLLTNGLLAAMIMTCATLFGIFLLRHLLRNRQQHSGEDYAVQPALLILFALGLGLAALSLITFLLGWAGLLQRWLFVTVLIVMSLSGMISSMRSPSNAAPMKPPAGGRSTLLMVLIPLAALALVAALLPAGVLWAHDGRGYDVLEYHLQLPREYLQTGRVAPFQHNVYSYFPANAEMLYLLAMILRNDHIAGMYLAQIINLAIAIAFAVGVYLLLRNQSPLAAAVAAIVIAGPQLFFVATNAYVECFMLLMCLLALCSVPCVRQQLRLHEAFPLSDGSAVLLAGIFAGAACGSKYTALIMLVPIALIFLFLSRKYKLKHAALFLLVTAVTFSPWLIRNFTYTSNPIFPLAGDQLGHAHWTDAQLERWQKAHRAAEHQTSAQHRLKAAAENLCHPKYYGGVMLTSLAALFLGARHKDQRFWIACLVGIVVQVLFWMFLTHLQTRFLLPIIIPCAILIAGFGPPRYAFVLILLSVAAAAGSVCFCVYAYNGSTAEPGARTGFQPLLGRDDVVTHAYPLSDPEADYSDAKVLLFAEARPFYVRADYAYNTVFDHCSLAEHLAQRLSSSEVIQDLQLQGFTHLYVNWNELARLQRTYRFAPSVDQTGIMNLEQAGLNPLTAPLPAVDLVSRTLYEIPPAGAVPGAKKEPPGVH